MSLRFNQVTVKSTCLFAHLKAAEMFLDNGQIFMKHTRSDEYAKDVNVINLENGCLYSFSDGKEITPIHGTLNWHLGLRVKVG